MYMFVAVLSYKCNSQVHWQPFRKVKHYFERPLKNFEYKAIQCFRSLLLTLHVEGLSGSCGRDYSFPQVPVFISVPSSLW